MPYMQVIRSLDHIKYSGYVNHYMMLALLFHLPTGRNVSWKKWLEK
jgi:hypothetical protein